MIPLESFNFSVGTGSRLKDALFICILRGACIILWKHRSVEKVRTSADMSDPESGVSEKEANGRGGWECVIYTRK